MYRAFGFLLGFLALVSFADGYKKRWLWNTADWNNLESWDLSRVPCLRDRIVLGDGVVYVNENLSISTSGPGLTLARDGELILGTNSVIRLVDASLTSVTTNVAQCPGENIKYLGSASQEWLNPNNWLFLDERGALTEYNDGSLFVDRVPCVFDSIIFPRPGAFKTMVSRSVAVAEVEINGKAIWDIGAYLSSPAGKLRFKFGDGASLGLVNVTMDVSGTACGSVEFKAAVCRTFTCPAVCDRKLAFIPDGDCCPRCGALIKMKTKIGVFDFFGCQAKLSKMISKPGVMAFLSRIDAEWAQILVTNRVRTDIGRDAVDEALVLFDFLKSGNDKTCAGTELSLVSSAPAIRGVISSQTGNASGSTRLVLGILVPLILIVVVVIIAVYCVKRRRTKDFKIQKLVNEPTLAGMADVEMIGPLDAFPGVERGMSFENPSFAEGAVVNMSTGSIRFVVRGIKPASDRQEGGMYELPELNADDRCASSDKTASSYGNPMYCKFPVEDMEPEFGYGSDDPVPEIGLGNPLFRDIYKDEEELPPYSETSPNDVGIGYGGGSATFCDADPAEESKEKLRLELAHADATYFPDSSDDDDPRKGVSELEASVHVDGGEEDVTAAMRTARWETFTDNSVSAPLDSRGANSSDA